MSPTKIRSLLGTILILVAFLVSSDATEWKDTFPDASISHGLALASNLVFKINSAVDENIPEDMEAELFVETERGVEALVGLWRVGDHNIVFVALRGTDERRDWWSNMQISLRHFGRHERPVPSQDSPVRVHSGFNNACLRGKIYGQIEGKVKQLTVDMENPIIYFTGHSLGGVEALVSSSYMAHMNPDLNIQAITFGAPQLGNAAFKSWAEKELDNLSVWRFVYENDIVPRVLPVIKHTSHTLQIKDGGLKAYWRHEGGGDYAAVPSSWKFGMSVADHKIRNYITYLEQCVQNPDLYYPTGFERVPHCTKAWWQFWKSC